MMESDDCVSPLDEIDNALQIYASKIDGKKLRIKANHLKLLQFLEKWRDGDQYYAFIIVSIQQNNLEDVISFFHENNRHIDPAVSKVFYDLMDLLVQLSK